MSLFVAVTFFGSVGFAGSTDPTTSHVTETVLQVFVVSPVALPVAVAIMLCGFALVWNYVTTPISGSLSMAMMIDTIVEFALYGAIVGSIYKPLRSAVRRPATI